MWVQRFLLELKPHDAHPCEAADNWAENGRDLLNFIAYYLDAKDAGSDSDSLPRPAPDVPRELGLLDNVASIDPGSAIPTERTYRGRLIVGIGHSLGGSATVFAATACPALFSSLVLVDPVLSPPTMFDPSKTALVAMGALRRRGVWNSRKEAKESFLAKPFFRAWDPRILDGYVDLGMHELGTGQVALKTKPFYEAVSPVLPCACRIVLLISNKHPRKNRSPFSVRCATPPFVPPCDCKTSRVVSLCTTSLPTRAGPCSRKKRPRTSSSTRRHMRRGRASPGRVTWSASRNRQRRHTASPSSSKRRTPRTAAAAAAGRRQRLLPSCSFRALCIAL